MDTWALNKAYVEKLLPNLIGVCFLMCVGVVGNSLVLLVYNTRMKAEFTDRYFIPILAFFDLLGSILSSVYGILHYVYFASYPSEILCKILNYGSFSTSALSAQTLLLISIQRYRKICVPFGKQMTLFWKRLSVGVSTVAVIVYAIPVFYTSGVGDWKYENQTISRCATVSGSNLLNKIYFSGATALVVLIITTFTFLYAKIGYSIYKRGAMQIGHATKDERKDGNNKRGKYRIENSDNQPSTDISYISAQGNSSAQALPEAFSLKSSAQMKNVVPDVGISNTDLSTSVTGAEEPSNISKVADADEKRKKYRKPEVSAKTKWDRTKVNFNKMFGAIVLFYVISYIPTCILLLGVAFGLFNNMDDNLYDFINRTYILNNIVNPFVYGYFDFCFRNALVSIFRCRK